MTFPLFHVDAFTDRLFGGNPAGVCPLSTWKDDCWLQAVAREMNLSETAFLVKKSDCFDLRWQRVRRPVAERSCCGLFTFSGRYDERLDRRFHP